MALALARAGATVILWARRADRLQQVERTIQAFGSPSLAQGVDVTDPRVVRQAVAKALRRFRHIDILVNNAGIWGGDPMVRLDLAVWNEVLAADLTSVFLVSQSVVPSMIRRRYGKIINISSTSGILAHPEGRPMGRPRPASCT